MPKYLRCDRCKKIFQDETSDESFSINHRLKQGYTTEYAVYDFCPECQASLKTWMKNEQEK